MVQHTIRERELELLASVLKQRRWACISWQYFYEFGNGDAPNAVTPESGDTRMRKKEAAMAAAVAFLLGGA